ncbi:hypothetical protein ACM66B_004975 [Microbotryomycetes sp. NB124-2]
MTSTPVHEAVVRCHSTPSSAGSVVFRRRTRSHKSAASPSHVLTHLSRRDTLILADGPGAVLFERTPATNNKQDRYSTASVSKTNSLAAKPIQSPSLRQSPNVGSPTARPVSRSAGPTSLSYSDKENVSPRSPLGGSPRARNPLCHSPARPSSRLRHARTADLSPKMGSFNRDLPHDASDADKSLETNLDMIQQRPPPQPQLFVAPADVMPRERTIPAGAIGYDSDELTDADAEGSYEQDDWMDDETGSEVYSTRSSAHERDQDLLSAFLALRVDYDSPTRQRTEVWRVDQIEGEVNPFEDIVAADGDCNTPTSLSSSGVLELQHQDLLTMTELLETCNIELEAAETRTEIAECSQIVHEESEDGSVVTDEKEEDERLDSSTESVQMDDEPFNGQVFNDESSGEQSFDDTDVSETGEDESGIAVDDLGAKESETVDETELELVAENAEGGAEVALAEKERSGDVAEEAASVTENETAQESADEAGQMTMDTSGDSLKVEAERGTDLRQRAHERDAQAPSNRLASVVLDDAASKPELTPRKLEDYQRKPDFSATPSPRAQLSSEPLRRTSPRKVFATPSKTATPARPTLNTSPRRSPRRLPDVSKIEPPASVLAAPTAKRQLSKLVSRPVFAQRAAVTAPLLAAAPSTALAVTASTLVSRKAPTASVSTQSRLPAPASVSAKPNMATKPSFMRPTASMTARENARPVQAAKPLTVASRVPALSSSTGRSALTRPHVERKPLPKVAVTASARPNITVERPAVPTVRPGLKSAALNTVAKRAPTKLADATTKRSLATSALSRSKTVLPVVRAAAPGAIAVSNEPVKEARPEPTKLEPSGLSAPTASAAVADSVAADNPETPKAPVAALPLLPRPAPIVVTARSPEKRSAARTLGSSESVILSSQAPQSVLLPRPVLPEALLPRPTPIERGSASLATVSAHVAVPPSPVRSRPPSPPRPLLPRPAPLDNKPSALTASADDLSSSTDVFGQPVSGSSAGLRAARLKRTRGATSDCENIVVDAVSTPVAVNVPVVELLPRPTRSPRPTRRSHALQAEASTDSTLSDVAACAELETASMSTDGSEEAIKPPTPPLSTRSPFVLKSAPALTQEELNRLTQKNTKRNQISVNKLQVETIMMDCNRPPSPTSKIRRSLSSEGALGRPSSKEGREARAAKRRNALRSSTDGSEAALINLELDGQGGSLSEEPRGHFRGAGDDEEFVSPVRMVKNVKSAAVMATKDTPRSRSIVKSVKWDRALVYEAGRAPRLEPSNEGIIKRLPLDGFGNVVVPANAPVTKPVAVRIQKLVYKDDE